MERLNKLKAQHDDAIVKFSALEAQLAATRKEIDRLVRHIRRLRYRQAHRYIRNSGQVRWGEAQWVDNLWGFTISEALDINYERCVACNAKIKERRVLLGKRRDQQHYVLAHTQCYRKNQKT